MSEYDYYLIALEFKRDVEDVKRWPFSHVLKHTIFLQKYYAAMYGESGSSGNEDFSSLLGARKGSMPKRSRSSGSLHRYHFK